MSITKYVGDRFTCLSTDTKPTGVLDGAILYEIDTRYSYLKITGSWLPVKGPSFVQITSQTSQYNVTTLDSVVMCSGTFLVILPNAVGLSGKMYWIKNTGAGTVTATGQNFIDNSDYIQISTGSSYNLVSDNIQWRTI